MTQCAVDVRQYFPGAIGVVWIKDLYCYASFGNEFKEANVPESWSCIFEGN